MKKPLLPVMASFFAAALLMQPVFAQNNPPVSPQSPGDVSPRAFVPLVITSQNQTSSCSSAPSAGFDLIGVQGSYYKNNQLTDENADFRLSIIGYASTPESNAAPLTLVDYGGRGAGGGPPPPHTFFTPRPPPL